MKTSFLRHCLMGWTLLAAVCLPAYAFALTDGLTRALLIFATSVACGAFVAQVTP